MTTSIQILITLILTTITVLISGFSLWINWKNYSKYTKYELQNQIKQELKNSFEKIDLYPLKDQENWNCIVNDSGKQDIFYQKYYQVYLKWNKWVSNKRWEPNNQQFNDFINCYTKIKINSHQRDVDLIENTGEIGRWKNNESKIFWQFYFTFKKFLDFYLKIGFDNQSYLQGKLNNYSKILFSKKICKRLNQLINHQYK